MSNKPKVDNVSAMFDLLAEARIAAKLKEQQAVDARRSADAQIIELPEFQAIKKEKGATSLRSEKYKIEVEYTQYAKIDMTSISSTIPAGAFDRVFPQKREFSQSAYNAYIKELENDALTDRTAAKLLKRIKDTLAEHTTVTAGATQVKITPVE